MTSTHAPLLLPCPLPACCRLVKQPLGGSVVRLATWYRGLTRALLALNEGGIAHMGVTPENAACAEDVSVSGTHRRCSPARLVWGLACKVLAACWHGCVGAHALCHLASRGGGTCVVGVACRAPTGWCCWSSAAGCCTTCSLHTTSGALAGPSALGCNGSSDEWEAVAYSVYWVTCVRQMGSSCCWHHTVIAAAGTISAASACACPGERARQMCPTAGLLCPPLPCARSDIKVTPRYAAVETLFGHVLPTSGGCRCM